MSNVKGVLIMDSVNLTIIDLVKSRKALIKVLDNDLDFKENVEYFRKDTLSLGYKSESERLVDESSENVGTINSVEKLETLFKEVFNFLEVQEYFGKCEYMVTVLNDHEISVSYALGGHYSNVTILGGL